MKDIQTPCPVVPENQTEFPSMKPYINFCRICYDPIPENRVAIGKRLCLECGEEQALQDRKLWCVAPISNKAAYTLITDYTLLKQINPKRTTV